MRVLKLKVVTIEIDQFKAKACALQLWLFYARSLILENRRKLNLRFTKLGLVDCGAMTLNAFEYSPVYGEIKVASICERVKQN